MYIAILHPSYEGSAAPFKGFDPFCDPSRYLPGPIYTHVNVAKATAVRQVSEIARLGVDVAINLCDGAWDEDRPGIEVVQTLERLNIAFTGAGSTFYEPSREAMKMACHSAGGRFPPYVRARRMEDAERALARLRFPMIVKHRNSYSSIGLTRDSRVTDAEALRREVSGSSRTTGERLSRSSSRVASSPSSSPRPAIHPRRRGRWSRSSSSFPRANRSSISTSSGRSSAR